MTPERIQSEVYSILRRLNLLEQREIRIETISSGTTISSTSNANIYLVECPSGNVLIILPNANELTNKTLSFKKIDSSNTVFIQPIESQTIDGSLTYSLTNQYESITIVSDGTNFYITSVV